MNFVDPDLNYFGVMTAQRLPAGGGGGGWIRMWSVDTTADRFDLNGAKDILNGDRMDTNVEKD